MVQLYPPEGSFTGNAQDIYPDATLKITQHSGKKQNLVAKILATNFGVFFIIYVMLSKTC